MWPCGFRLLIINNYPVKFGSQRPREGEDISLFICHATSSDFADDSLPGLVAGLVEVHIKSTSVFNLSTMSKAGCRQL